MGSKVKESQTIEASESGKATVVTKAEQADEASEAGKARVPMNISDVIEEFIYETMGAENSLNLSRNELAQFFDCAPSQINYVLSTRFTFEKGFVCDSRRGGGGYISIARVAPGRSGLLESLESLSVDGGLSYQKACRVLDYLIEQGTLSPGEGGVLKSAISDKALALPLKVKEILRANILKSVLMGLEQEGMRNRE